MALTTVRPEGLGFVNGRRNLIINGAMQVAQRGDVTGKTASTHGGPDRFYAIISSLGTWSISQDTDVPSGSGFSSSYKLACTTADASPAAGDHLMLHYRMEGQDLQQLKKGTSSAESVTLSFWVKCYKTGNFQVNLYDQDNTRIIGTTVTVSIAATWEYKTLTFAGDTSGALGNDNGNSLFIEMVFDSGTNFSSGAVPTAWEAATNTDRGAGTTLALGNSTDNYFNITGVQFEVGTNASDFEHRSVGEELSACQRYFTKSYNQGTAVATATAVGAVYKVMDATANYGTENVVFPTSMRATPTVGIYSPVTGALGKFDSNTSGGTTDLNLTTVNIGDHGFSGQSNNQAVGATAYMRWHYTADAEL